MEGEVFDRMCIAMEKFNLPCVAVWEFKIMEIWDESASNTSGVQVV